MLTKLVSSGEGGGEAVVFDHRAAPLGVAHGANICHAESVTSGSSTQVLDTQKSIYLLYFVFIHMQTRVREKARQSRHLCKNLLLNVYDTGLHFCIL